MCASVRTGEYITSDTLSTILLGNHESNVFVTTSGNARTKRRPAGSGSSPCALVLKTMRQSNNVVAPINMRFATMNTTLSVDKWYCTGGALLSPRP